MDGDPAALSFFRILALCHSVFPKVEDGRIVYHGVSTGGLAPGPNMPWSEYAPIPKASPRLLFSLVHALSFYVVSSFCFFFHHFFFSHTLSFV